MKSYLVIKISEHQIRVEADSPEEAQKNAEKADRRDWNETSRRYEIDSSEPDYCAECDHIHKGKCKHCGCEKEG